MSSAVSWAQSHSTEVVIPRRVPIAIRLQAGDTLWGLSAQYHISISNLEKWNHVTQNSVLQINQPFIVGWTSEPLKASSTLSGRDSGFASFGAGVFGEQVIAYAKQFLGTPYVWGGESASGFDCSGLVRFVFSHFGISLGHSSYAQYLAGTPVDRSQLMPGDLVFFSSNGAGASHVGIYAGNGQFLNAEDRGVVMDSMDSGYWASMYDGARRISPA